jgi:hypothetical protein
MKIRKLFDYMLLKRRIGFNMVEVTETMALKEVSETYAKYVCKMHGWEPRWFGDYTNHFCAISFALIDGYIKALHDNGLEFQNGLVKKRDITEEMPCGALDYYRKDAIRDTKRECIAALERVMAQYETSKANISTIVSAFRKEIKED